jgi:hypothetical protein
MKFELPVCVVRKIARPPAMVNGSVAVLPRPWSSIVAGTGFVVVVAGIVVVVMVVSIGFDVVWALSASVVEAEETF